MSNSFGLIYFVHDDLQQGLMKLVKKNLFKAPQKKNVKIVFIHNIRKVYRKKKKESYVSYITNVQEVTGNGRSGKRFRVIKKVNTWEQGFVAALNHLQKVSFGDNLGLIVLSHAEGYVLKGTSPELEMFFADKQQFIYWKNYDKKDKSPENKYLVKRQGIDEYFISSYTIVDKVPGAFRKNGGRQVYERKYSREKQNNFFCKKYEGLFTFQLSSFLRENKFEFKFIAFSSCNAQLYDNGYLFSRVSEFTMGAESYSVVSFWDFPTIVNSISLHISSPSKVMSSEIFDACSKKFRKDSNEGYYYLMNVSKFDALHFQFNKILDALKLKIERGSILRNKVLKWICGATVASGDKEVPFYDIIDFFEDQLPGSSDVEEFKKILTDEIIERRSEPSGQTMPSQCGYSLFLPRDKVEFMKNDKGVCNYLEAVNENEFLKFSPYDEFIRGLYQIP